MKRSNARKFKWLRRRFAQSSSVAKAPDIASSHAPSRRGYLHTIAFVLLASAILFAPRTIVPNIPAHADGPLAVNNATDPDQLFPRMTPVANIAMPNKSFAAIAVDDRNIDHVAWTEESTNKVKYFNNRWETRAANGWSAPETVATTTGQVFHQTSITVISTGPSKYTVYVAWTEQFTSNGRDYYSIYYSYKTPGGTWQNPICYAQGSVTVVGTEVPVVTRVQSYLIPKIRCDSAGNVHLSCIYDDWHNDVEGNVQWISLLHSVGFGALTEIPGSRGDALLGDYPTWEHRLALSGTQARAAWLHVKPTGQQALYNEQYLGAWQGVQTINADLPPNHPRDVDLVADEAQTTHIVWASSSNVKYKTCVNGIMGTTSEQISSIYYSYPRVFISIKGDSPQVFWFADRTEGGGTLVELSYAMRSGGWHKQEPVYDAQIDPEEMATDANGFPRLINANLFELAYTRIWEPNMGWQDAYATAGWGPNTSANLTNGNLQTTLPLFSSRGVGFATGISLIYNGLDTFDNVMSQGWHITYHLSLTDHNRDTYEGNLNGTTISITFGDGHSVVYRYVGFYNAYIADTEYGDSSHIDRSGNEYVLVTKHGIRYTFNNAGKLRLIADTNVTPNTMTLNYTDGALTSVVDSAGRTTTLTYGDNPASENTTDRVLLSIVDAGTKTYSFGYDAGNKLLTITYNGVTPAISWTTTHSTVNGGGERINLLRSLKTPKNEQTTYSYRLDNRASSAQSPSATYIDENGQTVTQPLTRWIAYDDVTRMATLTNRRGFDTSVAYHYRYSTAQTIIDAKNGTVSRAFDDNRNLTTHTDQNGKTTVYGYTTGTPSYVQDNLQTIQRPGATLPITYSYTTDNLNNVQSITDAMGNATIYDYHPNGTGNLRYVLYPNADVWIDGTFYPSQSSSEYFEYDTRGRVTLQRSPNFGDTTYYYDPNPVTNPSGLATRITRVNIPGFEQFTYDVMGNLTQQIRTEGGVTDYVLDGLYRVTQMTAPLGDAGRGTTLYAYNANSQIETLTNPRGKLTTYVYDAVNRLSSIVNADNKTMSYAYDAGGNQREVTDFRGKTVKMLYDELDRVTEDRRPGTTIDQIVYSPELVTTYVYWPNGNLKDCTVGGTKTISYTYDDRNNLKTTTYPVTSIVETLDYDDSDRLTQRVLRDGGAFMGGARNTYDVRNRLSQSRQLDQDPALGITGPVTTFGYDDAGNQSRVVDPTGRFTNTWYDGFNRRIHTRDGYGTIVSQTSYDGDDRQVETKIQNPNGTGLTTSRISVYHPNGETNVIIDALNNSESFDYDLNSNLIGHFDAEGNHTVNEYDNLDRMFKQTREVAPGQPVVTQFGYDENGNRTSVIDPRNKTYGYTFDNMNRLIRIVYPLATSETWKYDGWGNMAEHTDANGKVTAYLYDLMDRLDTETHGAPYNVMIDRDYDGASNLTRIANGTMQKDFVYDTDGKKLNRLGRVDYTIGGSPWKSIAYAYDDAGNRTGMTDPEGNAYAYSYNANAQLASMTRNAQLATSLSYDSGGRKIRADLGNGTSLRYNYDIKERLTNLKAIRSQGDVVSSFSYVYNKIDNRTKMKIDHENVLVNYGYDGLSRLTSESWNMGAASSCVNQLTSQPAGNESGFSNTVAATPAAGVLSPYLAYYTYDNGGNRTGKYLFGGASTYVVDDENRLTAEQPFLEMAIPGTSTTQDNWVEVDFGSSYLPFRLDVTLPNTTNRFKIQWHNGTAYQDISAGAIYGADLEQDGYFRPFLTDCRFLFVLPQTTQKLRYWQETGSATGVTLAASRMEAGTSIVYGHDANGNMISRTQGSSVESYSHDYANRIATYYDQQVAYSYIFAPSGERMAKVNPDLSSEWYMYDGDDVVADYAKPSGGAYALTATYANGLGIDSKIARYDAQNNPGYYIPDALGSVHRILDGSQNVTNTYFTNAWGESTISQEGVPNRYGFTQRERDPESSLMHYRARSYDPRLGRFVQRDPIGMVDGPNMYAYVRNIPTTNKDSFGLQAQDKKTEDHLDALRTKMKKEKKLKILLSVGDVTADPQRSAPAGGSAQYRDKFMCKILDLECGGSITPEQMKKYEGRVGDLPKKYGQTFIAKIGDIDVSGIAVDNKTDFLKESIDADVIIHVGHRGNAGEIKYQNEERLKAQDIKTSAKLVLIDSCDSKELTDSFAKGGALAIGSNGNIPLDPQVSSQAISLLFDEKVDKKKFIDELNKTVSAQEQVEKDAYEQGYRRYRPPDSGRYEVPNEEKK